VEKLWKTCGKLRKPLIQKKIKTCAAVAARGVFSVFGAGTRDGAVLNAITFSPRPFAVTTHGAPTCLAIYVAALNLSTPPTVTIGGTPVNVTFYGNGPCCAGLRQINVELPPSLAGAGRVEVSVTACRRRSGRHEAEPMSQQSIRNGALLDSRTLSPNPGI
jgi:hypothetical protein